MTTTLTQSESQPTQETLSGSRVAFTGKLASMTRPEAREAVLRAGGEPTDHVSRRTSLLVVGMAGWPLLPDGSVSNKLRRAEVLNRQEAGIGILSEIRFLELLGLHEPRSRARKTYRAEQICDMLRVSHEALHRWELLSLVESHAGMYDYEDIVSLRTIAELVSRGVRPETIAKSLRSLAFVMPAVDRPLAQLKIVAENHGSLIAEIGDDRLTLDGQFTFGYQDKTNSEATLHMSAAQDLTAADWIERGCEAEERECHDEAQHAFRRAVALEPYCTEAYFNLGNVLREQNRLDAVAESFRSAVAHDPFFAVAHFNLADVLEDQGKLDEAVSALHAALKASPTLADAHFNLAQLYERLGTTEEARHHWMAYLKLDSSSEWADVAIQRLTTG